MKLSNRTYDILVYVAQIFIPALATLYATLAKIWDLPYGFEITATLSAIDVFLGALLKISSVKYNNRKESLSSQFNEEDDCK